MVVGNEKAPKEIILSLIHIWELAPPLSVRDAFPKVLIARTRHGPYIREGLLVLDLAR